MFRRPKTTKKNLIEGDEMSDTIKSSSDLKLTWEFADGDTRTHSVKNPKNDLTPSDIRTFANATVNSKAIIGDKTGAAVTKLKSAFTAEKTDVYLDIS